MRLEPWTSARPSARAVAAVAAVAVVHVGILMMLTWGNRVPHIAREPRPFIVRIYPRRTAARETSTAATTGRAKRTARTRTLDGHHLSAGSRERVR